MQRPLLFDSVLFDLDGTLVATDRFWVQAARTGARRAFEELGIERDMPTRAAWLSVIGHSLADGFERLFGDLDEPVWRRILAACEEEEAALLAAGGAALMPGARSTLTEISVQGARIGIASNCAQSYLDHMLRELDLASFSDAAYCLDTAGIGNKADMIENLLHDFSTRSAVMVGDRAGDRDAAWANGLPHVHCAFGFAGGDEPVEAEGVIEDMGELLTVLDGRGAWIVDVLDRVGFLPPARDATDEPDPTDDLGGPRVLGVTGTIGSGKSLWARDAARLLRARGCDAVAVSMEGFRYRQEKPARPPEGPAEHYDLERLERELFEPLAAGAQVRLTPEGGLDGMEGRFVGPDAIVVLEGPFLLDPRLQSRLDRSIALEVREDVFWRRLSGTVGRLEGLDALGELRSGILRDIETHAERYDPARLADLVVEASNPLGQPAASPA